MYPCRFQPMREDLPPIPAVAKELARLEAGLVTAGVPRRLWRYDLPRDTRLDGIRAYNRGVEIWNKLSAEQQRACDRFARRRALGD